MTIERLLHDKNSMNILKHVVDLMKSVKTRDEKIISVNNLARLLGIYNVGSIRGNLENFFDAGLLEILSSSQGLGTNSYYIRSN